MNKKQAINIIVEHLKKNYDEEIALINGSIVEYEHIFVFYYQSKKYIETNDISDMLLGPGPNILDKHNKTITYYGSADTENGAVIDYCNKKKYKHNILPDTNESTIKNGMSENELDDFFEKLEAEAKEKFDYEDDCLSQEKIDKIFEKN